MSPWGPVRRSDVSSPVCPTFFRPWWLEGYGGWWCCTTRALCSVAGVPEEPLWTTCMGVIKKNMSSWTGRAQGKNVTLSHHQLWREWKKGPLLLACRGVLNMFGLLQQNTVGWVVYGQQTLVSHNSEGRELKIRLPADLVSEEDSLPAS